MPAAPRTTVIDYSDAEGLLITGSSPQAVVVDVPAPLAAETYAPVKSAPRAPQTVVARPPAVLAPPIEQPVERDVAWLTEELGRLMALGRPGYRVALYHLERLDPSPQELSQLFEHMRSKGSLADFTHWVAEPEMWAYLSRRGVDWAFVLDNYEFGVRDGIDLFAGMTAGALKSTSELVVLPWDILDGLYVLTGSVFDRELAQRRDDFLAAMRQLLRHPLVSGELLGKQWWNDFNGHLGRLEWFQAGAMIGAVLPDVISAIKAAPAVVKGAASLAAKLPRMTAALLAARFDAAFLRDLVKALKSGRRTLRSEAGDSVELIEDVAVLRRSDGTPEGTLPLDDDFVAQLEKRLDELDASPADDIRSGVIDPTVGDAIDFKRLAEDLVAEFPQGDLSNSQWGTLLHRKAAERLNETFVKLGPDLRAYAEEPFSAILELDPTLRDLTVDDFLKRYPETEALTSVARDARVLGSKVSNLKPDLVIWNKATGQVVIVDLAPELATRHLRKTQLYASILERLGLGVTKIDIGEYYYRAAQAAPKP